MSRNGTNAYFLNPSGKPSFVNLALSHYFCFMFVCYNIL